MKPFTVEMYRQERTRRREAEQRIRELELDLKTTRSLYAAAIDRNEVLAKKLREKAA